MAQSTRKLGIYIKTVSRLSDQYSKDSGHIEIPIDFTRQYARMA
jgi:hypothetical protein